MPSVKGISTYQTYLMYRSTTSGTFAKVIDITSFPDLIPPKEAKFRTVTTASSPGPAKSLLVSPAAV